MHFTIYSKRNSCLSSPYSRRRQKSTEARARLSAERERNKKFAQRWKSKRAGKRDAERIIIM